MLYMMQSLQIERSTAHDGQDTENTKVRTQTERDPPPTNKTKDRNKNGLDSLIIMYEIKNFKIE